MSLLEERIAYKPFRYPWAYEFWKIQQQVHWMPEEVPLGEDCKDWAVKLSERERSLLTQIFRFFTQSDVEVGANYMENYMPLFKPIEVRMMLASFSNMETIHIAAYALLLETIGMPETEFSAFMEYEEMAAKHDYLGRFGVETERDILTSMAVFGGFTEGLQLFASFAMLMNFPRFNKMKGMGQIVSWSVRDETLHTQSIIRLFRAFVNENPELWTDAFQGELYEACRTVVEHEDAFIGLAFEEGGIEGLSAADVKAYIRYIADRRLGQLGLQPIYGAEKNPLPWMDSMLNGVEHANFFENRATEYTRAATQGTWEEAFD